MVDVAPADELAELTRLLRAQLRRHRALGAWAAPGGPTAAYVGAAGDVAAAADDAAAEAADTAVAAGDTAVAAGDVAVATGDVAVAAGDVAAADAAGDVAGGVAAGGAEADIEGTADAAVAGAATGDAATMADMSGAARTDGAVPAADATAGPVAARSTNAAAAAPAPRSGGGQRDELAEAMAAFDAAIGEASRFDEASPGRDPRDSFAAPPRGSREPSPARGGRESAPAASAAPSSARESAYAPTPAREPRDLFAAPESELVPLGRRTLAQVREELGECTRCKLHSTRRKIVFGVGAEDTPLMFVGEAPGEQEDKRGEPFVGPAGELLDKMIEAMGWTRDTVYIANTTKCRPPGNRNPQPDELAQCTPFLDAQIQAISPRIIVTLGRPAANHVLRKDAPISSLRGRFHDRAGVKVMPTFHPAYLLRDPDKKKDTWADLKQVIAELERLGIKPPKPSRG